LREEKPRASYALALLLGALAMASKSSTVILPLVLCLMAWWVKGRWEWKALIRLVPMFAMSLIAGLATISTQNWQVMTFPDIPDTRGGLQRLLTAADAIWFYLGKLIWPTHLLPIYPRWQIDTSDVIAYLTLIVLLIGVGFLVYRRRETWSRALLFALGCFVVALFPALGFFSNAFSQFSYVSDHFQYLASMAPLALLAAGLVVLGKRMPGSEWAQPIFADGLLFVLGLLSCLQTSIYEDDVKLWTYVEVHNPQCWIGHNNLGVDFFNQGRIDDALEQYREAVTVRPDYALALNNLALMLVARNQPDEAEVDYQRSIASAPRYPDPHKNYGDLLLGQKRMKEGLVQYDQAIAINPNEAEYHNDRGVALARIGDLNGAVMELEIAVKLDPNSVRMQKNLEILRQTKIQPQVQKTTGK
jgi:tetratricopeptide (TPR) repeat protein